MNPAAGSRPRSILRLAVVVGAVSVLSALAICVVSYRSAMTATEARYQSFYLTKARMLVAAAQAAPQDSDAAVLEAITRAFDLSEDRPPDEYVCVLDRDARWVLHTARPHLVGNDAGAGHVVGRSEGSDCRLRDLVAVQESYVGDYISSAGQQQMAAFVPIPERRWLLGVHRTRAALLADVRSNLRLLAVGFIVVCGLLLPTSLMLLSRTFRTAQRRRAQAERALIRSQESHRTLLEHLPQRIFYKDQDLVYLSCNEHYARDLGIEPADIVGRTDHDFHPRELADKYRADDARIMASGSLEEIEEEYIKDGRTLYVHTVKTPVRDEAGNVLGILGIFWDVTARRRAEQARRESEQRYRDFFANASVGFHVFGPDQVIIDMNQTELNMLGYNRDEVVGRKKWPDLIIREEVERFDAQWRAIVSGRGVPDQEYTLVHKDGHHVHVLLNASARFDDQGRLVNTRGTVLDISERKRAEIAATRLGRILESSLNEIYIFNTDNLRFIQVNRGARVNLGYTMEELRNLTPLDLEPEFAPKVFARLIEPLRTGAREAIGFTTAHLRKDGSLYPVEVHLQLMRYESEPVFVAIMLDITRRKRVEDSLLNVAKGVSASIGESFFREVVLHLAKALAADYAFVGELAGDNDERVRTVAVCADGQIVDNFEYELRNTPCANVVAHRVCLYPRGVQKDFPRDALLAEMGVDGYVGAPVLGTDGRVLGLMVVLYRQEVADIAAAEFVLRIFASRAAAEFERSRSELERKELEDQLRQAQKMEAVGQLAGGVAHDFNNILTAILGNAELAANEAESSLPSNDELVQGLQQIRLSAERAAGLTRQLLAFSRRQVSQPKILDLNRTLTDLDSMLRRLLTEDIRLTLNLSPNLLNIRADAGQIEQVVLNLTVNARDAMPNGGHLSLETTNALLDDGYVSTHPDAQAGPHVVLAVSDTGCGMDAATAERVFEPFFTTKGMGQGTGLGLATVYGIIKQSGGHVRVYSEPGRGTTFKVYLPAVDMPATRPEKLSTDSPTPPGTETILFCEDHEMVRHLGKQMLTGAGYEVLAASDGRQALDLAAEHAGSIDLLVTDVVMPDTNGKELAETLLATNPRVKTLFMSGYTSDIIAHHGVLDEGVEFLEKPFNQAKLLRRVREVLDGAGVDAVDH